MQCNTSGADIDLLDSWEAPIAWESRCLCRCRIGISDQCYLFDCSREPPPLEEEQDEEQLVPSKPVAKNESEPEPELEP